MKGQLNELIRKIGRSPCPVFGVACNSVISRQQGILNTYFEPSRGLSCYHPVEEAAIDYHLGLSYVAEGAEKSAPYAFLRALYLCPGDINADNPVDALERRVRISSDSKHLMVKMNIDHALKSFRYQSSDQASIGKVEASEIFGNFVATLDEIDSMDHYRNPSSVSARMMRETYCMLTIFAESDGVCWYDVVPRVGTATCFRIFAHRMLFIG